MPVSIPADATITAKPEPKWWEQLGDTLTSSQLNPLVRAVGGPDYGDEPGPADLLTMMTGFLSAEKLAEWGGKKLMGAGAVADKAIKPISKDVYALKGGAMDRRNFLYRASTRPEKLAQELMKKGSDKLMHPMGQEISDLSDRIWMKPEGNKKIVDPATGAHWVQPEHTPEDISDTKRLVKAWIDKMNLVKRVNNKYQYYNPKDLSTMNDPYDVSDAGSQLTGIAYGAAHENPNINPKLIENMDKAANTDAGLNSLTGAFSEDGLGNPLPNVLRRGAKLGNDMFDESGIFKGAPGMKSGHEILAEQQPATDPTIVNILKRLGIRK